ncbi:hypothetical protein FTUN_1625 [Frigoriglobus tundricola]|uniref:Uncharacterized protein n=1 Tax=Frigoriglobus tundricola TaxID=2774151 RepID=A0A6M5YLD1_9BACT|nr:hypothetical protein FTUN_1625 [Frigoriglobus tundricola]
MRAPRTGARPKAAGALGGLLGYEPVRSLAVTSATGFAHL